MELVDDPVRGAVDLGAGINRLVVQVESLDTILADLAAHGIAAEPPGLPAGTDGPRTTWITDLDGYRIELVQWPVHSHTSLKIQPPRPPHRMAIGLIGELVPPGSRSGAMTHRKDQRPAAWHTGSRSSNCR